MIIIRVGDDSIGSNVVVQMRGRVVPKKPGQQYNTRSSILFYPGSSNVVCSGLNQSVTTISEALVSIRRGFLS